MALTQNQLDDAFNKQLQRPATPFEYTTYKNSSLQDINNIGKTYNSLNKDNSISDYLKFNGQDQSLQNRTQLGQKYGITNLGSAEGNTALLNALRQPAVTQTTPNGQQGTVGGASSSVPVPQDTTKATSGSIATAGSTYADQSLNNEKNTQIVNQQDQTKTPPLLQ